MGGRTIGVAFALGVCALGAIAACNGLTALGDYREIDCEFCATTDGGGDAPPFGAPNEVFFDTHLGDTPLVDSSPTDDPPIDSTTDATIDASIDATIPRRRFRARRPRRPRAGCTSR